MMVVSIGHHVVEGAFCSEHMRVKGRCKGVNPMGFEGARNEGRGG